MAWKVDWAVSIDGNDRTQVMSRYLISIEVSESEGSEGDKASLVFDDTEGQLKLPSKGAKLAITMDGVPLFSGVIDDVPEWSIARGSGRQLSVSAKSFDSRSKVKEAKEFHKDNASLQEFMDDFGKRADIERVIIDPEFASIKRDHWSADGESFLHYGNRMAAELGGTFKIRDKQAVLAKRGDGKAPTGGALPVVEVDCAKCTTSLRIKPGIGRADFSQSRIRYFDRKTAKWVEEDVEIRSGNDAPQTKEIIRAPKADRQQAQLVGRGRKAASKRDRGAGSATIDLNPTARVEGTARVLNARDGIDGDYRIRSIRHRADRSGGSITELTIGEPSESVGKDERKSQ